MKIEAELSEDTADMIMLACCEMLTRIENNLDRIKWLPPAYAREKVEALIQLRNFAQMLSDNAPGRRPDVSPRNG